jgi:predicted PurR-regulated permease PerM
MEYFPSDVQWFIHHPHEYPAMNKDTKQSSGTRFLFMAAALVIIIAGIRVAQPILVPFLLSLFIAIISGPPLSFLHRKGVPRALALLIVVAAVIAIGLILAVLVGTSIDDFSRSLPVYQARLKEQMTALLAWLGGLGIDVPAGGLQEALDPGAAMKLVAQLLTGLGGALTNAFLILITVTFILLEASGFFAKLRTTVADPDRSFKTIDKFLSTIQRYMKIKTVTSLATGIAVAVWLAILGVDYPLLWGLLAFLLNYVPNIGSILAAVPAVLLALLQLGGGSALLAALGYLVVNFAIGTVTEPRIMGRGLGLSTLVVFLSLVFWGWVLGPVGMFLSVPLTMTFKIALDSSEDTRWIAVLMGPDAPVDVVSQPPPVSEDVS